MRLLAALLLLAAWPAVAETGGWVWKEVSASSVGYITRQGTAKVEINGPTHKAVLMEGSGKIYATIEMSATGTIWKALMKPADPRQATIALEGHEVERNTSDKCKAKNTAMFQEAFVLTNGWTTVHLMVAYCDT